METKHLNNLGNLNNLNNYLDYLRYFSTSHNATIVLCICLFTFYIGIVICIIYIFLSHRKLITSIFELDILLCPVHSPLGFIVNILQTVNVINIVKGDCDSDNACRDCKEETLFISNRKQFTTLLTSIHKLLIDIKEQLDTCTSKCLNTYKVKLDKYIWICENTQQNWDRLFSYPDNGEYKIYTQICKSYEYIIEGCSNVHSNLHTISQPLQPLQLELEDIEQVTIIYILVTQLETMTTLESFTMLDANFAYILALFKDICNFSKDLHYQCSSDM